MPSLPTTRATVVLAERPAGGPVTPTTFRQESSPIPELKDGEVLVRVDYVSMVLSIPPLYFITRLMGFRRNRQCEIG